MPSETFTHSAVTAAPRRDVWEALDRPETWEAIGGIDRVLDSVVDDDGRLTGFSFESVAAGLRYLGSATPRAREEGRLMAWNVENSEIRGVTTVELTDEGRGTRIHVTLNVESAGMLSSMFFPAIAGAIGTGLPKTVEDFAAGFGEE